MTGQVCLRCDWTGEAGASTCPECGTVLYRMPAPKPPAAPVRPRARSPVSLPPEVFVPVVDRSPPEPRPSRAWIVAIAVTAVAVTAIATIEVRTPATPPAAQPPIPGLRGSLVYAARDPSGWVLWSWDLATGEASQGPHVEHPVELVSASRASPGWIGVTSADGRRLTASVVHSLSPESRVSPIVTGNLVTWAAGGQDLTSLRFGPRGRGCIRHVEIRDYVVAFGTHEVRFRGPICGVPLTIARDGTFDYLVEANGPSASIRIIDSGYTQRFVDDHVLLGLSTRGDFLVMPVPRPGEDPVVPPPGLQLYHRPPLNHPMSFGSEHQPLLPLGFLSWSWDASEAYILGSYDGVRGVYRVTIAPGVGLRTPELVDATNAEPVEATVTSSGDLFLLLDGKLVFEHGDRVDPISLPGGAPNPAGPILWIAPGGTTSGLA